MPIYELSDVGLIKANVTSFESERLSERYDLQQLLRTSPEVLGKDLLVIAEEFGDWIDSNRRIDLLCVDRDANLVVVELKRTVDGGHMDLQAIRYAAMVSAMTFEQAADTARRTHGLEADQGSAMLLEHFGWERADDGIFGSDTRILLAAADFGRELTTAVLWLRDRGIDISCIRLQPCRMSDGRLLIDAQQIIPVAEVAALKTRLGVGVREERHKQMLRHTERLEFWDALLVIVRQRKTFHAGRSATDSTWISTGAGKPGFSLIYHVRTADNDVALWIAFGPGQRDRNKRAFAALQIDAEAIQEAFGGHLEWREMPESDACTIVHIMPGGYRSPKETWAEVHTAMVDAMVNLEAAFRGPINRLNV